MPFSQGNWVAITRVVEYYAAVARALSAGIKWRYCICDDKINHHIIKEHASQQSIW